MCHLNVFLLKCTPVISVQNFLMGKEDHFTSVISQNPRMVWFESTLCLTGSSPTAVRSPKCSLNGRHWMSPKLWKTILHSVRNTMDVLHLNETLPISPQKKGLIPPVVQLYTNKFFGLENRKKYYFEMWRKTPFLREGSTKSINFKKIPGLIPNKVWIFLVWN